MFNIIVFEVKLYGILIFNINESSGLSTEVVWINR